MKAEMNDATNVLAVRSSKDEQGRALKLAKDSRHSLVKPQDQAPADEGDQGTVSTVRTAEIRALRFFRRRSSELTAQDRETDSKSARGSRFGRTVSRAI